MKLVCSFGLKATRFHEVVITIPGDRNRHMCRWITKQFDSKLVSALVSIVMAECKAINIEFIAKIVDFRER